MEKIPTENWRRMAAGGIFAATDIRGYRTSQGAAARVYGARRHVHINPAINSLYSFGFRFGRVVFLFRIVARCVQLVLLECCMAYIRRQRRAACLARAGRVGMVQEGTVLVAREKCPIAVLPMSIPGEV